MDYKFFIDPKMKASKYLIYKCDNLPIEMVLNTDQIQTNSIEGYNICIEKHKTMNLIQIRLSSTHDNSSVFICTVDDAKFEQFKIEQSLFVTFEYFVKNITEMMEKCRQKKMHVILSMVNNNFQQVHTPTLCQLQFYEKGTFKNLVHISLPIIPAPYEVILFHINQTYAHQQEENRILMQKNNNFQLELAQKSEQIDRLNGLINGLKVNLNEQEKMFAERYKEQIARLEQDIREAHEAKNYQRQELEKQIAAFRTRVDGLIKENYALNEQLKNEIKQTAQLRSDGKKALTTIGDLNQQIEQLNEERLAHKNAALKSDHVQVELRKQIQDFEQKVYKLERNREEISAELEAERNICQIKKDALKIASEDICNANTIIRRQSQEIEALRKKVELRTEVALKQEQLLREAELGKSNENRNDMLEQVDAAIKRNAEENHDTEQKIKWIRDRTNLLENKYQQRIEQLYEKIQSISGDSSSNRNFSSRRSYEKI